MQDASVELTRLLRELRFQSIPRKDVVFSRPGNPDVVLRFFDVKKLCVEKYDNWDWELSMFHKLEIRGFSLAGNLWGRHFF